VFRRSGGRWALVRYSSGHEVHHLASHGLGGKMNALAVAGEARFKLVIEQAGEGLLLLEPRVPAVIAKGGETLSVTIPGKVIAGEEVAVFVEQDHMTRSVAGRGNGKESGGELCIVKTADNLFGVGLSSEFFAVNDAMGAEMP